MKDACKDEETVPLSPVPGNAEVAGSRRGSRRQLAQATTVLSLKDARPLPTSSAVRYFQAPSFVMASIVVLYMVVSMSMTLLDKWLISGRFPAPLSLVTVTYLMMFGWSTLVRWRLRRRGAGSEGAPPVQDVGWSQWLWRVAPVAAASGLEVGTSALGLQKMNVGFHTMVRAAVPVFVLMFSVAMGLQSMRLALVLVIVMVSGGVALLSSGEHEDLDPFPVVSFLLTLLSGVIAGLKWTLSQVLLQGKTLPGSRGTDAKTAIPPEQIYPLTLLHYMSLTSSATLLPFVCALEGGKLESIFRGSSWEGLLETLVWLVACSQLALVLVLTEFSFIRRVSSLSLCIIGVVKELILVAFSVALTREKLSGLTAVGFVVTLLGVSFYKLVAKGPPPEDVSQRDGTKAPAAAAVHDSEIPGLPLMSPSGRKSSNPTAGNGCSGGEFTEEEEEVVLAAHRSSGVSTPGHLDVERPFADAGRNGEGAFEGGEDGDGAPSHRRAVRIKLPGVSDLVRGRSDLGKYAPVSDSGS